MPHSLITIFKCLSDVLEAYLGAVFVDSEFKFEEIERFFETHIRWFFEDMSIYDTFANSHPTVSFPCYEYHSTCTLCWGWTN